jgi:hypothetical protein
MSVNNDVNNDIDNVTRELCRREMPLPVADVFYVHSGRMLVVCMDTAELVNPPERIVGVSIPVPAPYTGPTLKQIKIAARTTRNNIRPYQKALLNG